MVHQPVVIIVALAIFPTPIVATLHTMLSINYVKWGTNMCTILLSLCQWGMINSLIACYVPADVQNGTVMEAAAIQEWDPLMEIRFQVAESVKSI